MKHTKNTIIKETTESRELYLYAENERDIYFTYIVPIVNNLAKHYKRGNFDKARAVDAFFPAATAAAKKYCKEFADVDEMPRVFDVTARYTAAAYLLESYIDDIKDGGL